MNHSNGKQDQKVERHIFTGKFEVAFAVEQPDANVSETSSIK